MTSTQQDINKTIYYLTTLWSNIERQRDGLNVNNQQKLHYSHTHEFVHNLRLYQWVFWNVLGKLDFILLAN